jgi:hypothetical protein
VSVVLKANDGPLRDYLRLEPQRQAEGLRLFQEEGSILAMEELRSNVPVRSGFLRESVSREILPDGFTVYPAASYAGFVDQGSRPHTIFPRSGKVLRFENQWGATIFARKVEHPGFLGRFFMQRTAENLRYRLAELVRSILERVYRD